jgi:hypothetical protein
LHAVETAIRANALIFAAKLAVFFISNSRWAQTCLQAYVRSLRSICAPPLLQSISISTVSAPRKSLQLAWPVVLRRVEKIVSFRGTAASLSIYLHNSCHLTCSDTAVEG